MSLHLPLYPSAEHREAACEIARYFSACQEVDAVLLVGSCARGRASKDSCLDITVLIPPDVPRDRRLQIEGAWQREHDLNPLFALLKRVGKYSHVDLEFADGTFRPGPRGWTSGPDDFELEIGSTLVYSSVIAGRGEYLSHLKQQYLPYYAEPLRLARLGEARLYCINNLEHIPLYVERGLYFQCLDRLWKAFKEFLQGLFISRRVYPIAYDKWISEQIKEILGLPELYRQLCGLFEISQFESAQLAGKASTLRQLVDEYFVR